MARFRTIRIQYSDDAGDPVVNGKLFFYEPGTTTFKDTFADVNLTIPNTNPVILSASGIQPDIFFSGSARVVLTDKDSVQLEVRDPVGGDASDVSFPAWDSDTIWNIPDIVVGSDLNFYVSIVDNNSGNDPTGSPAQWTQIRFIRVWNTNETYSIGQIVEGTDGLLYSAVTGSNTGNNPTTDTVNWKPAVATSVPAVVSAAGKVFAYNNF